MMERATRVIKMTKYRGYSIFKQKEFGPLRLLKWVGDGDFIVVKGNANALPCATFRNEEDAKKVIDILERFRSSGS
jgi:hypothetical protein